MKKILLAVTMMMFVATAFANNEEINPTIENAFKNRFPGATSVEWSAGPHYYKASFFQKGSALAAFYDDKAQLIGVMRNVSSTQLPSGLQARLKKYFSHYWITDLFEMTNNDGHGYYVTFRDADSKMVLESNDARNWKLLSISAAE